MPIWLPKKLERPLSLRGNIKPTCPVEIDWGNKLSNNLNTYINDSYLNLVDKRRVVLDLGVSSKANVVTENGIGTYFNASGISQGITPNLENLLATANGVTASFFVRFINDGVDHALLDIKNQSFLIWADTDGGQLRLGCYSGGAVFSAAGLLNSSAGFNKVTVRAERISGTTFVTAYVNKVKIFDNLAIGTRDWTGVPTSLYRIGRNQGGSSKAMAGYLLTPTIWERLLSDTEIESLHQNPNQFLISK